MKSLATATLVGLGLSLSNLSYADTLFGLYVGGGSIDYDLSGSFTDLQQVGASEVDLEQDLGLSGDVGSYLYIAIEHGIPIFQTSK